MFETTRLSASLVLAFSGAFTSAVLAQQTLERVEVTGSSIRRVDAEGALPVTVLQRADIDRTGATSVTDLLQKLPGLQGGITESSAVGGGGNGFSSAAIHGLEEQRTLVLLNGRRVALFGGQQFTGSAAAFDLNTLPLAAIERVEVLTDGASALYGADAIAGVINFITRRDMTTGDLTVGASSPRGNVAREERFSLTKGVGELERDGYNVMASFAVDRRSAMDASDRDFARTGSKTFEHGGKRYHAFVGSPRSGPANVLDNEGYVVSPYFLNNGRCPPGHEPVVLDGRTSCDYDFSKSLQIVPARERHSLFTTGSVKLSPDHTLFADLLLSRTRSTSQIAPVFSDFLLDDAQSPAYQEYLAPLGLSGPVYALWRASELGPRREDNTSDLGSFVVGSKGALGAWDYKAAVAHSHSRFRQRISNSAGGLALARLVEDGVVNPLAAEQTPAGRAALSGIAYAGEWDGGDSKLTSVDMSASRELSALPGGPLSVGVGASVYQEHFANSPSLFAQGKLADPVAGTPCDPAVVAPAPGACEQRAGDAASIVPYSARRRSFGTFLELNAPVAQTLELSGAVRYDHYDDFGSTTNGKGSFRWKPARGLLIRGSLGTGFKAPSVPQVKATSQPYGMTSYAYDASQNAGLRAIAEELGAQVRGDGLQYDQVASGNPDLKPERSRQGTLGIVFEPVESVSLGADYWRVKVMDVISQVSEGSAFADPLAYRSSWTVKRDNATGVDYIAFLADNRNLGERFASGIDLNLQGRAATPLGRLTTQLLATYMLKDRQQQVSGGEFHSPVGEFNPSLLTVTFRWQGRATASLQSGNWTHTVQAHFKSGYKDAAFDAQVLNADGTPSGTFDGITLKVKRFVTFDFQTRWQATRSLTLTGGLLNAFDRDPPLSLAQGGLNKGHMFGYDDRYHDPRGRTLYVNGSMAF